MKAPRKLTLWLYGPHEMAEIKEGRHTLILGNYWDFHSGCYGSKISFADGSRIDFAADWTESIRRPWDVVKMIASRIGATVETRHRKTPFSV